MSTKCRGSLTEGFLECRDQLIAADISCDIATGHSVFLSNQFPGLSLLVDMMSTVTIQPVKFFHNLFTSLCPADLIIPRCQNRNPFRNGQITERPLHHIGLHHINPGLFIRQILFHDSRDLFKPCNLSRILSVMTGKHFIPGTILTNDHRRQNAVFLNAIHHVIKPLALIQAGQEK